MVKILELFSGYGTASFALKRIGMDYELVGYSDIDKYANQCFKQNHCPDDKDDKLRLGDVTKINPEEIEDFDLLTGGFPCQAFSNAGKMKGELDPRGTLFNEIIRIAEVKQPKYMLLENVKGFTFKKFKDTFDKVLSELDRIGYIVYWKVLNSKDFGTPQKRERIWFVCFRKDVEHNFSFPEEKELTIFLKDILEDEVDEKYYLKEDVANRIFPNQKTSYCIDANYHKGISVDNFLEKKKRQLIQVDVSQIRREGKPRIYEGISKTLNTAQGGGHTPLIATYIHSMDSFRGYENTSPAIKSSEGSGNQIIINTKRIRKLTPKECFRLMGFLNDEINLEGLSDTQRYKLAGNGQDVNVVSILLNLILKTEKYL